MNEKCGACGSIINIIYDYEPYECPNCSKITVRVQWPTRFNTSEYYKKPYIEGEYEIITAQKMLENKE